MPTSATAATNALWACTALTLVILAGRLSALRYRRELTETSSYLVIASMLVLGARVACNYYILRFQNASDQPSEGVEPTEAQETIARTTAALVITARLLITTFYWLQCTLLLLLYRRILGHMRTSKIAIQLCWFLLGSTYLAIFLTSFLECRPFHLYWQIYPDPGGCVRAYGQLWLQCMANIAIDLVLLFISAPIIRTQVSSTTERLKLVALYILGFVCIIATALRVSYIYGAQSAQSARSFWASVQAVLAAFVANVPSMYGAVMQFHRRRTGQNTRTGSNPWSQLTHDRASIPSDPTELGPINTKQPVSRMHVTLGKEAVEHIEWYGQKSHGASQA